MISFGKVLKLKSVSTVCAVVLAVIFSSAAYGAGDLDSTFAASAFGASNSFLNTDARVDVIKTQADGKVLIGGSFSNVGSLAASGLARFNADGSPDTSFKAPDFYGASGIGGEIFAIAVQADGKILVGGNFTRVDDVAVAGVRRLNPDGSLDPSFLVQTANIFTIYDIEVQPDNKILIGGYGVGVFRVNSDGTPDNTFAASEDGFEFHGVRDIELQADGKIYIGGGSSSAGFLRRLNSVGGVENHFRSIDQGEVYRVKVRPDGKIIVTGSFSMVNSGPRRGICLFSPEGNADLTFVQGVGPSGDSAVIKGIFLKPDGKILLGGRFTSYNGVARNGIAQVNEDGTLNSMQFGAGPSGFFGTVNDIELLPDGKILAGGQPDFLAKFNGDGTVDTSFTSLVSKSGTVYKILPTPDGKIVAAGEFRYANGVLRNSLARFNADGSLDTSFVPFFTNLTEAPQIFSLAVQPDGKVLVGLGVGGRVRRLNTDGTEDTGFIGPGSIGVIYDIAMLPNSQILISGDFGGGNGYVRKLSTNGALDGGFSLPQANGTVHKVLVQPDGKILIGGIFTQINSATRLRIARLNANGSVDNTFQGGASSTVYDMDLQADGKIIVGGAFTSLNGSSAQASIGRLNADGTLDTGFVQSTNSWVLAVKVQPDGKILIGGTMSTVQGAVHGGIARLNSNGTVDTAFNTYANTRVLDINFQSDGKILLGGGFTKINNLSAIRIARLNLAETAFDFDGDGRADIGVFRPSEGKWYINKSTDGLSISQWGLGSDQLAPADYDGDGKTDLGIYRDGQWWYFKSSSNTVALTSWGAADDIPMPSDFDADGKADFIFFRPATGEWFRKGSNGAIANVTFGLPGDVPLIGDFNGDGKADPAIFRPSDGYWWYLNSANGLHYPFPWGANGDIPVPGDYDGDGKTDYAVFRPTDMAWYILNSQTASSSQTLWGFPDDLPTPADYDGDGKTDIAIYRPSNGMWFALRSTSGFYSQQFGLLNDKAVPNTFLP